jgi:hypothetical protein
MKAEDLGMTQESFTAWQKENEEINTSQTFYPSDHE